MNHEMKNFIKLFHKNFYTIEKAQRNLLLSVELFTKLLKTN